MFLNLPLCVRSPVQTVNQRLSFLSAHVRKAKIFRTLWSLYFNILKQGVTSVASVVMVGKDVWDSEEFACGHEGQQSFGVDGCVGEGVSCGIPSVSPEQPCVGLSDVEYISV